MPCLPWRSDDIVRLEALARLGEEPRLVGVKRGRLASVYEVRFAGVFLGLVRHFADDVGQVAPPGGHYEFTPYEAQSGLPPLTHRSCEWILREVRAKLFARLGVLVLPPLIHR